ncbi:hypothetical protein LJF33_00940 [Emcibacteraceae bacterium Y4]|nr:hypothetical protein [Pseudemcibacter aquimaris]MCC3859762.1 hypothetical protein [Pseudemcibacter aquimaris]
METFMTIWQIAAIFIIAYGFKNIISELIKFSRQEVTNLDEFESERAGGRKPSLLDRFHILALKINRFACGRKASLETNSQT